MRFSSAGTLYQQDWEFLPDRSAKQSRRALAEHHGFRHELAQAGLFPAGRKVT
jgi:hypothetical protein